jgi:protein SCO1/2
MTSCTPANRIGRWALMVVAVLTMSASAKAAAVGHGERPLGITLDPLFQLVTHEGRAVTRADVRGKPFVVLFGYTNCDDLCPTSLFEVSILLRKLGQQGDRLPVLFVTVDPEHDTPAQLKDYLESFDSRIIGLTGSRDQIAAVTAAFQAPLTQGKARKGEGQHLSQLFFMDRYGLLAKPIDYSETDALGTVAQRLLAQ